MLQQLSAPAIGHAWARFALATLLLKLHNRPSGNAAQLTRAVEMYTLAAEAGVVPALKNLANMYELGIGVEQNDATAVEWLRRSAKAGDPSALVRVPR